MSSTERTRSISGSGPSIMGAAPTAATVCDHHQLGDGTGVTSSTSDLTLHHHNHHSAHGLLANDYVIGTMSLFQNFASGVGEQGGQHSSGSANSSSSAMNISHISSSTESSLTSTAAAAAAANRSGSAINITHNVGANTCRFPKLEECAHFHYERVQLGQILFRLIEDRSDLQSSSNTSQHDAASTITGGLATSTTPAATTWFIIRVTTERSDAFLIRRSLDNLKMLDEMLHRCVYDRKISGLRNLGELDDTGVADVHIETMVSAYLNRFSTIVTDSLTCGPVLTWFQLDNKGRALPLVDMDTMKSINTPAVGAAYGIRKYTAQAVDEISIDVGDMISVIDMPSPAESTWWRGKKYQMHLQKSHYEVGFFPQTCVATIGDKLPRNLVLPAPLVGSLAVSPTKPVLRKHGKLIAFFRSFILSRPSRRRLKQSGIYKERVFSCDLSEHLLNSRQDIPKVLRCCADFIEESGIVDGIYRLSGITSNIQKLRRSFDEECIPDFTLPEVRQDIHALSSLLKMYFRELPNPLCTYQLYDNFVDAIQTSGDAGERLRLMKETVQKLPPPHYRTLKYLAQHLNRISHHHLSTGMTDRNLAIVWAPNLLRSPALESGDDYISGVAALRGVGVQAVVTEYLITNCGLIFDAADDFDRYDSLPCDSLTDSESIQLDQRDPLDHPMFHERPKSLSVGGAKLISLEEAQTRHNRLEFIDVNKTLAINTPSAPSSTYIEVGGGPSSLPDKYHTILTVPRSWSKRNTHSWKSLFTRNPRHSAAELKQFPPTGSVTKPNKPPIISRPSQLMATNSAVVAHISLRNGHDQLAPAKSIDLYDGGKPLEVCGVVMRSSSIDSLRTVGHSRSVSHDSYFDLLQSPLRSGGNGTCVGMTSAASRELSELGLNFDREEPEMRIFSESESLVSSPRVMKDASRRSTARCRPDEHPINSAVNPSPKKQPRLNIPHYATGHSDWSNDTSTTSSTVALANNHQDESLCKRYKLEDQLSDIQFIDCNTPEHCAASVSSHHAPNTIYASAQIHSPPRQDMASSRSSVVNNEHNIATVQQQPIAGGRYSYPGMKSNGSGSTAGDDDNAMREERFSYPGMGHKFADDKSAFACRNPVLHNTDRPVVTRAHNKQVGRFSYCDPSAQRAGEIMRSNSADIVKKNDLNRSKLSILTPSSPGRSPRYSLLVSGDTSSECSSSLNTPVCDMDVSQCGQLLPAQEASSPKSNASNRRSYPTKDYDSAAPKDLAHMKRELSLDLDTSKMSVDGESSMKQTIHLVSTPNTPNCMTETSGNTTSQSVTPSEFGYQHLATPRQSTAGSPSSPLRSCDVYENLERSFGIYDINAAQTGARKQMGDTLKLGSPIRSTINITYNLKSPSKLASPTHENVFFAHNNNKMQANASADYELVSIVTVESRSPDDNQKKPLLETSFDENMVYEQVKFFKGAVSEVNSLMAADGVGGGSDVTDRMDDHCAEDVLQQVVPDGRADGTGATSESIAVDSEDEVNRNELVADEPDDSTDVPMYDHELDDIQDSLEMDPQVSMYENVEQRRPDKVYANVNLVKVSAGSNKDARPSTFNVRQLANKFETSSPVDAQPPFDFSKPFARKVDSNRNSSFTSGHAPKTAAPKNHGHILHGTAKITRSLDENAFVREFGNKVVDVTKSVQQIGPVDAVDARRMSLEFARPKTLNPPKRLPDQSPSEEAAAELCKTEPAKLKLNLTRSAERCEPIKITPTTENPISLIQHNVVHSAAGAVGAKSPPTMDDDNSLSSQSSQSKVLGSCKLDRDRIEKIKEERRLQLNEKFRTESFRAAATQAVAGGDYKAKSKSKIELRGDFKDDAVPTVELRVKSKSRNDVRSVLRDSRDGLHQLGGGGGGLGLTTTSTTCRVRRISDERNQNDCVNVGVQRCDAVVPDADTGKQNVATSRTTTTARKFDLSSGGDLSRASLPVMPRLSMGSQRGHISPQFSIRDVTAMFESRSQQ